MLTLLVLANWFACTVRCELEKIHFDHHSAVHDTASIQSQSSTTTDEDCRVCDWVMAGGCKTPESRIAVPVFVAALTPAFLNLSPPDNFFPPKYSSHAGWSAPPPEQAAIFLSVCRTALPVRAPSILS